MLVFACISPHPPIILPSVGSEADRKEVEKTTKSLEKLGKQLAKAKPDCVVITSPHPDWGIDVPWFFLRKNMDDLRFNMYDLRSPEELINHQSSIINHKYAIYPILTTSDSPKKHYQWGQKIAREMPNKLRYAWIASGDMSHRLKEDGPYGLHPSGPRFDKEFINLLKKKDVGGILHMDPKLVEEAGECGLRSFCQLLGVLEGAKIKWQPEILSYEAPFGVGYLVANFKITNKT